MVVLHNNIPNIIMHIYYNRIVDSYRVRRNQFDMSQSYALIKSCVFPILNRDWVMV